jgi:acetolactate synthase small subunit
MYSAQSADRRKSQFATEVHCRYMVMAEIEPSVLPRIVALFAQRDLIPSRLYCQQCGGPKPVLQIEISVAGLERQHAEHLALRMRNIAPVTKVMLDWC